MFRPLVLLPLLFAASPLLQGAQPPLVAVGPAVLHRGTEEPEVASGALSTLVQPELGSLPSLRLVERAELDRLLAERSATSVAAEAGQARLENAGWLLRFHLHQYGGAGPRVEAEVVDTLRGDVLARRSARLEARPDEGTLLLPDEKLGTQAAGLAREALLAALEVTAKDESRTLIAPLAFINRSGSERAGNLEKLLRAALAREDPHVRVLRFDAPEGSVTESSLITDGLVRISTNAWERVADAFVWGEYEESAGYSGPVADAPVSLKLFLWGQGEEPVEMIVTGTLAGLPAMAEEAAHIVRESLGGARLLPTQERRIAAANKLRTTASALDATLPKIPDYLPGTSLQQRVALAHRLRLLELASFFNPEDAPLELEVLELRSKLAMTEAERCRVSEQFWDRFNRRFLANGSSDDEELIGEAGAYFREQPGYAKDYLTFAVALRTGAAPAGAIVGICNQLLEAFDVAGQEADTKAAFETLWAAVLGTCSPEQVRKISHGPNAESLRRLYISEPGRLEALLTGKGVTPFRVRTRAPKKPVVQPVLAAAAPSAAPARPKIELTPEQIERLMRGSRPGDPPPPPPPRRLKNAGPFLSWTLKSDEELTAALAASPLAAAPRLTPPALLFRGLPYATRKSMSEGNQIARAALEPGRAVLVYSAPSGSQQLVTVELPGGPSTIPASDVLASAGVRDVWVEKPGERWCATAGGGIRVLGPTTDTLRSITVADGLDSNDVRRLVRGRDAVFVESAALGTRGVTAVPVDGSPPRTVAVSPRPELQGLPNSALAAIASFSGQPVVALPAAPAVTLSVNTPAPSPQEIQADLRGNGTYSNTLEAVRMEGWLGSEMLTKQLREARLHCTTGPRDGLWIAGWRSVLWASGDKLVPLAHWSSGVIDSLHDDGRHLIVRIAQIALGPPPIQIWSQTLTDSDCRLYIYDYQQGRWLGWVPSHRQTPIAAGDGMLLLLDYDSDLRLVDLSEPTLPRKAPESWTPLHAAVWRRDLPGVKAALERGASVVAKDKLGVTPLDLAATWGGAECLGALLQSGQSFSVSKSETEGAAGRYQLGASPLALAVAADQAAAVSMLLAADGNRPPPQEVVEEARLQGSPALAAQVPSLGIQIPAKRSTAPAPKSIRPSTRHPGDQLREILASSPLDLAKLRAHLEQNGKASLAGEAGARALSEAIEGPEADALDLLLPLLDPEVLATQVSSYNRRNFMGALCLQLAKTSRLNSIRKLAALGVQPKLGERSDQAGFHLLRALLEAGEYDLSRQFAASLPPESWDARSVLPTAAAAGDEATLRAILKIAYPAGQLELEQTDFLGRTSLAAAVLAGHARCVSLLLEAGANVAFTAMTMDEPLFQAVARNPEVALAFAKKTGSPEHTLEGATAAAAATTGAPEALSAVSVTPAVLAYRDFWGWSVLHTAAYHGRTALVRLLLARGAKVDAQTASGASALVFAAQEGHADCVEALLAAGANPNLAGDDSIAPLAAAAFGEADVALVKRLLAAGADPKQSSGSQNTTALLLAASRPNRMHIVKCLLEAGCRMDALDSEGNDILVYAAASGSAETVDLLFSKGYRARTLGSEAVDPLERPAKEGDAEMVRALLRAGVRSNRAYGLSRNTAVRAAFATAGDPSRRDEIEWPQLLSMDGDWRSAIERHLLSGGRLEHRSGRWFSPLYLALCTGGPERVEFLLKLGAKPDAELKTQVPWNNVLMVWFWKLEPGVSSPSTVTRTDEWGARYLELLGGASLPPQEREYILRCSDKLGLARCAAFMRQAAAK